jgi:hypothetical protein
LRSDKPTEGRRGSTRHVRLTYPAPFDALWSYRRRPADDLATLKAARAAIVWRTLQGGAALGAAARYSGWLTRFPVDIVRFMLRHGGHARRQLGRGYGGQVVDMLRVAAVNGLMPREYYNGALARHGGGPEMFRYVPYPLYAVIATHLSRRNGPASLNLVEDKDAFERHCRALGLPVARTLAIAHADRVALPDGGAFAGDLPPSDVILKPFDGHQGDNIERWNRRGGGYAARTGDTPVSSRDVLARASMRAATVGSAILIQECLANHAALAPIAGAALATTRVVTFHDERGEPEVVEAFHRTSVVDNAPVDNFHAGGVLFPIDVMTGCMTAGCDNQPGAPLPIFRHPQTGADMPGRPHPGWAAISALALRTHRHFPDLPFVGWDIAFTPHGPVLIEANVPPGISGKRQSAHGGLVGTRFLELLAFHARRWLDANEPPTSRWRLS